MNNNSCCECFKEFSSLKSLEFHKVVCIYHQYRNSTLYNSNISNDVIKNIIILFNSINLKINDKPLSKKKILANIKMKYRIKPDNIILYLYDVISQNQLDYCNYSDIINLISSISHVQTNDIINIINTFNICSKKLIV